MVLVCVAIAAASCGGKNDSLTGPSQTRAEARRDHVVPVVAALSLADRLHREVAITTPEGRWLVSELPNGIRDQSTKNGCRLGNGTDAICTLEYGEILLVNKDGVRRAYPFPEIPPRWIHAHGDYIYAGAIGDGGLPSSSLVRINRKTLASQVIVFPVAAEAPPKLLPGWRLATAEESAAYAAAMTGATPVRSSIGPTSVDTDRIDALFSG
jgi:hypothetical protein